MANGRVKTESSNLLLDGGGVSDASSCFQSLVIQSKTELLYTYVFIDLLCFVFSVSLFRLTPLLYFTHARASTISEAVPACLLSFTISITLCFPYSVFLVFTSPRLLRLSRTVRSTSSSPYRTFHSVNLVISLLSSALLTYPYHVNSFSSVKLNLSSCTYILLVSDPLRPRDSATTSPLVQFYYSDLFLFLITQF